MGNLKIKKDKNRPIMINKHVLLSDLSLKAVGLWSYLVAASDSDGSEISLATIKEKYDLDDQQLRAILDELQEHKLLFYSEDKNYYDSQGHPTFFYSEDKNFKKDLLLKRINDD